MYMIASLIRYVATDSLRRLDDGQNQSVADGLRRRMAEDAVYAENSGRPIWDRGTYRYVPAALKGSIAVTPEHWAEDALAYREGLAMQRVCTNSDPPKHMLLIEAERRRLRTEVTVGRQRVALRVSDRLQAMAAADLREKDADARDDARAGDHSDESGMKSGMPYAEAPAKGKAKGAVEGVEQPPVVAKPKGRVEGDVTEGALKGAPAPAAAASEGPLADGPASASRAGGRESSTSPGTSDVPHMEGSPLPNMERSPSERARSSRRRAVRRLLGAPEVTPEGDHLKVDELLTGVVHQVRERFRRTAVRASVPALPLGQHQQQHPGCERSQHPGSASSSARRSAERRAHKDAWERVQQRPAYEKGSHDHYQGSARRSASKAARWDKERVGEVSASAPGAGNLSGAAVPTLSVQQHV